MSAAEHGGFVEWLWRGRALRQARGFRSEWPEAERERLLRAERALELGDRAFDPVDRLHAGSSLALSVSLYREAVYWGLLAQDASYEGADLATLFQQLPQNLLEFVSGGADGLSLARRALVARSFVDTAELTQAEQHEDARVARELAHALVRRKLEPQARVGRLLLQRGVRSVSVLLLLGATLAAGSATIQSLRQKPDLAAGKPWRASSSLEKCHPAQHRCAGARTNIFFSTAEEMMPWVELDLGAATRFARVEVINRSDCCPDRAAPLAVEVSQDQAVWREVARRDDSFSTWRVSFAPQTARYVRLRALRRTILQLEKIAVRAS